MVIGTWYTREGTAVLVGYRHSSGSMGMGAASTGTILQQQIRRELMFYLTSACVSYTYWYVLRSSSRRAAVLTVVVRLVMLPRTWYRSILLPTIAVLAAVL